MPVCFDHFRFDRTTHRLEDPSGAIPLNPKAFDVLGVLIEARGRLVSKEQLLDAVWSDAHVADGVLKVSIAELRRALGDSVKQPRFIETVHRLGYRFVAPIAATEDRDAAAPDPSLVVWPAEGRATESPAVGLVGRGAEIARLEERFARALEGERQLVFVTGEAGAGKTALVQHFAAVVATRRRVAITGSPCLEQFGAAEAYMPVLEAVGRLARADDAVRALLRRYAPTWLAQLPWLIEEADRDWLRSELRDGARERMLREMAAFVEALAAEIPLILVLDDLHWSDPSTVDLLSLFCGRPERARVLVLATYRPAELVLARHPLRAVAERLVANRQCAEVSLDDLGVDAVAEYLERRFAGSRFPAEVSRLVRERTDGNPLFLVTVVDHLLARGAIVEHDRHWHATKEIRGELAAVPESLRRLIAQQLDRLPADARALLEAASLVGLEFSAAAAAAGADRDPAEAEIQFERLAAGGPFVQRAGITTWPDGTVSAAFAFRHALYREALATALSPRRRADVHLRIGTALEHAHGESSGTLGAELALHFEAAGDRARAARYRRLAAETAARRYACAEAETHLVKGLELLGDLAASPERDREELALQSALGAVRMATRGYAAPEVERAYTRAFELSSATREEPSTFPELWGLWVLALTRAELARALELAVRIQTIAEATGDRAQRLQSHQALSTTHFFRGELAAAFQHVEGGEPLYDLDEDRGSPLVYGSDAKAVALSYRSLLLWSFGRIDEALAADRLAVDHARAIGHPMTLGFIMVNAGWLRLLRREPRECQSQADEVIAFSTEHGVPFWIAHGLLLRGWARVEQGDLDRGIADTEQGLASMIMMETRLGRTAHYAQLAAAKARAGRVEEARESIERSKVEVADTGERYHEPEIHRLDAEIVLIEAGGADRARASARERAEALLHDAVACAQRQGARTLALRAMTALVRLHRGKRGRHPQCAALGELLAGFTEGFDTTDLQEARRALG